MQLQHNNSLELVSLSLFLILEQVFKCLIHNSNSFSVVITLSILTIDCATENIIVANSLSITFLGELHFAEEKMSV